ncbi:MAG TPA: hypothetical protein VLC72_03285 [Nitrosopumilaceae archaeon]|nr:hypothetical protein [Nitrosopumilaceae archaeon]
MHKIDYEKFCNEVFNLDKNIRFVGIFDGHFSLVKLRDGLQSLLTPEETKNSLIDTYSRWKTRQGLSKKLGKPLYAMAEYEKVKRITIPLNDDGLILVSTEPSIYHEIITKQILGIRDKYLSG